MRFVTPLSVALFAALAYAQSQFNAISIPSGQSTLQVASGQSLTISWTNPSSGTVTIKLQQLGDITPDSGITLACKSIPLVLHTAAQADTHLFS